MGGGATAAGGMWGPSSAYLSPVDTWEDNVFRKHYFLMKDWYIANGELVCYVCMYVMSMYRWGKWIPCTSTLTPMFKPHIGIG